MPATHHVPAALFALALALAGATVYAQQQPVDPIQSARDGLEELGRVPWYDAEQDAVRPVDVTPPPKPPERPEVAENLIPDDADTKEAATLAGSLFYYLMMMLGLGALAITLLVIVGVLLRTLFGSRRGAAAWEREAQASSQVDRLDQLPVDLRRARSDLLSEVRRHYENNAYDEAMIYLYSYLLVELDKAQRIRLRRGKTNRQYLLELRHAPELRAMVGQAMIAFEDVYFGGRRLSRERFEACYSQLDQFHLHAEPATA